MTILRSSHGLRWFEGGIIIAWVNSKKKHLYYRVTVILAPLLAGIGRVLPSEKPGQDIVYNPETRVLVNVYTQSDVGEEYSLTSVRREGSEKTMKDSVCGFINQTSPFRQSPLRTSAAPPPHTNTVVHTVLLCQRVSILALSYSIFFRLKMDIGWSSVIQISFFSNHECRAVGCLDIRHKVDNMLYIVYISWFCVLYTWKGYMTSTRSSGCFRLFSPTLVFRFHLCLALYTWHLPHWTRGQLQHFADAFKYSVLHQHPYDKNWMLKKYWM